MLTPNEISNKRFEKSSFGSGYKTEDVDSFLEEVIISYSALYEEKEAAEEKLEVLADKLEEYRSNEDSLRTVLLGAQKLGDNIIRDSKAKAEVILAEAENQAKQVFSDSESKITKERESLVTLQKETADFKKRLLSIYRQHLELISLMPEPEAEKPEVKEEPPKEELQAEPVEEAPAAEEAQEPESTDEDDFFSSVSMDETKRIELDIKE